MKLQKEKYNNKEAHQDTLLSRKKKSKIENDNRPQCPQCGNRQLNFLIVEKDEWNCSNNTCRKSFRWDMDQLNPAV